MTEEKLVLGIDTSNYKTSVALVSRNEILLDLRKFLNVKEGQRGLRQSEALFQHINNLPELFAKAGHDLCTGISAVAFSGRPRSVEGSYMPCFLAGSSFAVSLSSVIGVPAYEFSHQDGHIEAVRYGSVLEDSNEFIACHFSGGTCEILKVGQRENTSKGFFKTDIIGGTKDISFGQVIDRAGVKMGMAFPCGEEMDRIALSADYSSEILKPIKTDKGFVNLSGIETQIMRSENVDRDLLVREIFDRISDAILKMLVYSAEATGISDVVMSGGVSSSLYLRKHLNENRGKLNLIFDDKNLSSDNAVGTALLGGRMIWD